MDKKKNKNKESVEQKKKHQEYVEEYSYDFIPTLHEWVNIDEQKEIAERLEDIEKD